MPRPPRPTRPPALGAARPARRDADPSGMLAADPVPDPPTTTPAVSPAGSLGARLGIRDLRGQLTALVRRAGTGERIVITIGGRPIAQLGPVEPATATVTIDDLVARGLLEPARRGDRPADPEVVVDSWTGRRLDHALREVRGA